MSKVPESHLPKRDRGERRKKFNKVKDLLNKNFGRPICNGYGPGKPNICDLCKQRVYKSTSVYNAKTREIKQYCDDCLDKGRELRDIEMRAE